VRQAWWVCERDACDGKFYSCLTTAASLLALNIFIQTDEGITQCLQFLNQYDEISEVVTRRSRRGTRGKRTDASRKCT
jgi:hypothetical protein